MLLIAHHCRNLTFAFTWVKLHLVVDDWALLSLTFSIKSGEVTAAAELPNLWWHYSIGTPEFGVMAFLWISF